MPWSSQDLLARNFRDVARCVRKGDGLHYDITNEADAKLFQVSSALYAFCSGETVLYVGKTANTLDKRFAGYRNPGPSQSTNKKAHAALLESLKAGQDLRILVFVDNLLLEWAGVGIDLAAGLEESLIRLCEPPLNDGQRGTEGKGAARSESAEREREAEGIADEAEARKLLEGQDFSVSLGAAGYHNGKINCSVEASEQLGLHGAPIRVYLGSWDKCVDTFIDRHANSNRSVRIQRSSAIFAEWFQTHFKKDDTARASIVEGGDIFLHLS